MPKSKTFFLLSIAFLIGIFFRSFWYPHDFDVSYLYYLLILAIFIIIFFYRTPAMTAGFFVLIFAFGVYLTENKLAVLKDVKDENFFGEVEIVKEPEIRGLQQRIISLPEVRPLSRQRSDLWRGKRILITAGIFPEYKYGDVLKVDCKLQMPENIENGDNIFDYRMYLAKDGIYYICNNPKIESENKNDENKFYAAIIKIKNEFNGKIISVMPSPQSGLLSGLLIGGSGLLSKDYQNYFSLTGTTHIVAVSGYNVTIVAEYLMLLGIFLGLWRPQAFWFATIGIILFVVFTGMPSSAVRAGVMGILLIWAMKNGRLANSQNAILCAASIMLLINPLLLRWDVGFQLSFLATLGIVYVYPIFNYYVVRRDALQCVSTITETLFLTLAAQVFVLPILMINFGKLSLISPLANVLVLPIIPITMLIGFVAIVFNFIIPPLGQVFAWLAFLPLKYETIVIKFLAGLKYASIDIESFKWWMVVGWYIILIMIIHKVNRGLNADSNVELTKN